MILVFTIVLLLNDWFSLSWLFAFGVLLVVYCGFTWCFVVLNLLVIVLINSVLLCVIGLRCCLIEFVAWVIACCVIALFVLVLCCSFC